MVGIHEVFADLDVSLVNENTSLMDALGLETFLINTSLETFIQKFVNSETQNVIELEFLVCQKTISVHSVEEGSSFEKSSGIFLLKSKQLSGGFSESGEEQVDSPNLTFVLEAVFAYKLEFVIDSFLFEGSSWGVEGGRI